MSQNLSQLMQDADKERQSLGDQYIATDTLLLALMRQQYSPITEYLTRNGVTAKKLQEVIQNVRGGQHVNSQGAENTYQSLKKNTVPISLRKPELAKWTPSSGGMTKFVT